MKKFCKNVTYNGAKVICKSKNSWLFGRKKYAPEDLPLKVRNTF